MIVEKHTDKFEPCVCGHKPESYEIGYGSKPYILNCECGKSLHDSYVEISGGPNSIINYWNKVFRHKTIKEANDDMNNFINEKNLLIKQEGERPRYYAYFWDVNEMKIKLAQNW